MSVLRINTLLFDSPLLAELADQWDMPMAEALGHFIADVEAGSVETRWARRLRNGGRYIPAWLRRAVMDRDRGECQRCGSTDKPQLDHKVPWTKGGEHSSENLHVLCGKCNRSKFTGTWNE